MKRVIIIGCPGSGKSTFSRALSKKVNIPVYYLDMMFWNADKTSVDRSVLIERLQEVFKKDKWIIDGNYGSTMEFRMQNCDTVVFLDYPIDVCVDGIKQRQGKPREDMPWIATEEDDIEFIDFIKNYNLHSRPKVMALIERYSNKKIIIFKSRAEADNFLTKL